ELARVLGGAHQRERLGREEMLQIGKIRAGKRIAFGRVSGVAHRLSIQWARLALRAERHATANLRRRCAKRQYRRVSTENMRGERGLDSSRAQANACRAMNAFT